MVYLITINYETTQNQLFTASILAYDNNDAISCLNKLVAVKRINGVKKTNPVHAISEKTQSTIIENSPYVKKLEQEKDPDAMLLRLVQDQLAEGGNQKETAENLGLSKSKVCRLLKKE